MKKSKIFLFLSLPFMGGILISSFFDFGFNNFYLFLVLLIFLILSIIFWSKYKFRLIALCAIFLLLGMWRFGLSQPVINQDHVAYYNNQQIELTGQIVDEPDIRASHTKLTLGKIHIVGATLAVALNTQGKILINAPNNPLYNYGTWLKINCELQQPGIIEDFNYGKFLAVKGIYSTCYYPSNLTLINGPINPWQKFRGQLINFKFKFKKIINQTVKQPQSEILSAMILGLRKGVPQNILDNFSKSGLSHIIAVSGLHITIVAGLLMNLLLALGLKRKYAFYFAILGLILFLLIIGFRASSIRAGIMGFLVLLALHTGRLSKSVNGLLLAGCILLLINPKLLLGDVGFQLSFLAVLGIIYLGYYIEKFLTKIKVPDWLQIKSSLMMTLSAQAMVLPMIVYHFGNLSLIAPLANILILPLLPFIMIIGFILAITGFIFLPLAQLVGYLINILIGWVLLVAEKLSALPGANFEIKKIDFVYILIIYMLLVWAIWLLKNNKKSL